MQVRYAANQRWARGVGFAGGTDGAYCVTICGLGFWEGWLVFFSPAMTVQGDIYLHDSAVADTVSVLGFCICGA